MVVYYFFTNAITHVLFFFFGGGACVHEGVCVAVALCNFDPQPSWDVWPPHAELRRTSLARWAFPIETAQVPIWGIP